jgi:uncharacterized protein YdhG (YjbR/CyaY superfamily)
MKSDGNLSVDAYIGQFDDELQKKLNKVRSLIQELAPDVSESMSYQIPTFKLMGKPLAHFAAYKTHIGFYPTPSAIIAFRDKLNNYKTSKGAIQFPLHDELPMELIREIINYRISMVMDGLK